jgi:hypothetical protein
MPSRTHNFQAEPAAAKTAGAGSKRRRLRAKATVCGALLGALVLSLLCALGVLLRTLSESDGFDWPWALQAVILPGAAVGAGVGGWLAAWLAAVCAEGGAFSHAPLPNDYMVPQPGESATPQPANWRRDASGDLMYPMETMPSVRTFGR